MSQKFKILQRDELIDIFHKVFLLEYQVSNSYLKDGSKFQGLDWEGYEGVSDSWIAEVFDGMGIDYWGYEDADEKTLDLYFEHLENQKEKISQLITSIEEDSQFYSLMEELLTRLGNDVSVDFSKNSLSYLVERIDGWG